MAKPTVQTVMRDPQFQGLPFEEKRKVLLHVDSDFAGLAHHEQTKVMNAIGAGVLPEEHPIGEAVSQVGHMALPMAGMAGAEAILAPTIPASGGGTSLAIPVAGALGAGAGEAAADLLDVGLGLKKPPQTLLESLGDVPKDIAKGGATVVVGKAAENALSYGSSAAVQTAKALAKKAEEYGVRLTPAELLKSKPLSLLEAMLEKVPLSSGIIQRFRGEQGAALEKSAQGLIDNLGTAALPQESGKAIQTAIQETNFARLKVRDQLYDKLQKMVPENTSITTTNLGDKARELLNKENQLLDGLQNKSLSDFLYKLSDKNAKMTFEGLKLQRERLNQLIGPVADTPEKYVYKQLKTAIDADISDWASTQKGPIESAFRAANTYHGAVKQLSNDPNIQKLVKANPEDVVNILLKPNNVTEFQLLRKATTPDDFDGVQRAVVKRLFDGNGTPANNLVSNMKKFGDNTINAALKPEVVTKLKDFAAVASTAAKAAERMGGNPSGTAQTLITFGQGAFTMVDPVKGAALVVAPPVLAKIYLSDIGRKLITEGFTVPANSARAIGISAALSTMIKHEQDKNPGPVVTPFEPTPKPVTPTDEETRKRRRELLFNPELRKKLQAEGA